MSEVTLQFKWSLALLDEQATERTGQELAPLLPANGLIFLHGGLGAGKTTFARGILRGLGHSGPVKSPTYTLLEPYEINGRPLLHFDFYRLHDSAELDFIGIDELLESPGLKLIEWPQNGADRIPQPDWQIALTLEGTGRRVEVR